MALSTAGAAAPAMAPHTSTSMREHGMYNYGHYDYTTQENCLRGISRTEISGLQQALVITNSSTNYKNYGTN